MIAVIKKGSEFLAKIFDDWWECVKWCDEYIKPNKGYDPTQYKIIKLGGFIGYLYTLKTLSKHLKNNHQN